VDGLGGNVTAVATIPEIDRALRELHEASRRWVLMRAEPKAQLLESVRKTVYAQAKPWATTAAKAKGVDGTPLAGEEWISGPWAVLYALNRYIRTLREIARDGAPSIPLDRVRTRSDGQVVVDVFPVNGYDKLLLSGIRAEVWMQPGITRADLFETIAMSYKQSVPPRTALVLGAGNIAAIAPLDVLYKLIADDAVCIVKMNPVNDYLGPIFEQAFKPLVDEGFVRFVYGGADVGKILCAHPMVDEVHITGSDRTHDAIVFGDRSDSADRKRDNDPLLQKPISSELGNVSPTIVVPGPWSDEDFRFQAEQIVTQKLHNDGFNCIANQVLVLPQDWDGTPKLLEHIESVMREARDRPAYYPGAADRCEELSEGHDALRYGKSGDGFTPRTIVRVDAESNDPVFTTEAFSSLLAATTLRGDTPTYLRNAVAFANDKLWGSLGANVVAHPATLASNADDVDAAIAALRYGCIAVNTWTGVGFLLTETTWGAFPGNAIDDVRSGIGVVHNSYLFDRAEKSVVYGPFAPFPRSLKKEYGPSRSLLPKPPWFVTNRMADKIGAALVDFEMNQSPLGAAKVAMLAMLG
jgi:Aldehyde dehydrogenase family